MKRRVLHQTIIKNCSLEAKFENKISNESPVAQAIMGLKVGDIADVASPNGKYQVKVLDRKRMSNMEIAKMLNTKEFRIMKTKELTRYYTEKEILSLIIRLSEIDLKIKTTNSDPNLLLQLLIINI